MYYSDAIEAMLCTNLCRYRDDILSRSKIYKLITCRSKFLHWRRTKIRSLVVRLAQQLREESNKNNHNTSKSVLDIDMFVRTFLRLDSVR